MTPATQKTCELAFIHAIPACITTKLKEGREKNFYTQLHNTTEYKLEHMTRLSDKEQVLAQNRISIFIDSTGWEKKGKNMATFLSFGVFLLEKSVYSQEYARLIEIINNLIEFRERIKPLPNACCWAGTVAYEKWVKIVEKGSADNDKA